MGEFARKADGRRVFTAEFKRGVVQQILKGETFVESFNGKMRDECLNVHWFANVEEARLMIAEASQLPGKPDAERIRPGVQHSNGPAGIGILRWGNKGSRSGLFKV